MVLLLKLSICRVQKSVELAKQFVHINFTFHDSARSAETAPRSINITHAKYPLHHANFGSSAYALSPTPSVICVCFAGLAFPPFIAAKGRKVLTNIPTLSIAFMIVEERGLEWLVSSVRGSV
jgi:hypothetical protein